MDSKKNDNGSPCQQEPGAEPEVDIFTRSALRSVMPKELPPTPPRRPSLTSRLRRLLARLARRR